MADLSTLQSFDVAVVGAGPVGLTVALALARTSPGARMALIAPKPALQPDQSIMTRDLRTAALFHDSLALIERAGADDIYQLGEPLAGIRMVDISDRLLRAPDVLFLAKETEAETGHATFGHNISNGDITASLERSLARWVCTNPGSITRFDARVATDDATRFIVSDTGVTLGLDTGETLSAKLVVAADGRDSALRSLAGISIRSWDYDQIAITTHFRHRRPHAGISTELHGNGGPCTTVPLQGAASSLVWMERKQVADALLADCTRDLAGAGFVSSLSARVSGFLGPISDVAPPRSITLRSQIAADFARDRVILVGDAAHAFPPIGAQGLNLGFRDAATAIDLVADQLMAGADPGATNVTTKYDAERRADISARSTGVDLLNQSLISELPFLPLARGAGLHAVRAVPALRRLLMRQGMRGVSFPALPTPFRR